MSSLWRRPGAVALALAVATLLVYLPVFQNELVNYDDDYYISQNPNVRLGLSPEGLSWAFTTSYGANWYPVTWISVLLDYELFGMSARAFHAMNLALHIASSIILFLTLVRMTGALGPSCFIAAVFALHPLHVESVAWAAERKDVLSGLFWMLTLRAYARYSEAASARRMALVALFLALGLMSKPMLVTLPFVLLLLDFWPLERVTKKGWRGLVLEKIPLLALVSIASVVTFLAQRAAGAVQPLETYSFPVRLANALVAYVAYIGKAFWPTGLSPYYPHPGDSIPLWQALAAGAFLAGATALSILATRRRDLGFVPVGWLWYVGTLVPVIGLVQVGQQAMADRYTYLPYIGLSIVVAFGAAALSKRLRAAPWMLAAASGAAVLAMAALATAQARVWRDSVTLFEHALSVTERNALAHINLGVAYFNRGRFDEAAPQLEQAIRIHAGSAEAHAALAAVRARQERSEEALELYRAALRLDPSSSETHREMGSLLLKLGDSTQALVHLREASALSPRDGDILSDLAVALAEEGRLDEAMARFQEASGRAPDPARLHRNWGTALLRSGDMAGAAEHLREAVRLEPENDGAHYDLGLALASTNQLDDAYGHLEKALALNPRRAEAHYSLGLVLARLGNLDRAAGHFQKSLQIDPRNAEAQYSLGLVHASRGDFEEAIVCYRRAIELVPDYGEAHNSWGVALASQGRFGEAMTQFRTALDLDPRLGQAHNNWGLALSQAGATSAAIEHFRAAVSLEPESPDGYNNLGVALAREGRYGEAAESFRKAVEIAPDHPSASRNLESALQAQKALEGNRSP
jgi:tetratricopeptide (TPR) repeat protein